MKTIQAEVAVYGPTFLPIYLSKGTDLLGEFYGVPSYFVDNHSPWKRLAKEFPTYRFILGRTYGNEAEDLNGVFLRSANEFPFANVFQFRTELEKRSPRFVLTRLDRNFLATLRPDAPRLSRMSQAEREEFNDPAKRKHVCNQILHELTLPEAEATTRVSMHKGKTRYQIERSIALAVASHAIVIRAMKCAKRKKEIQGLEAADQNIMNDTYLLQEALLLDCGLHTSDKKLKAMCRIAGVNLFAGQ